MVLNKSLYCIFLSNYLDFNLSRPDEFYSQHHVTPGDGPCLCSLQRCFVRVAAWPRCEVLLSLPQRFLELGPNYTGAEPILQDITSHTFYPGRFPPSPHCPFFLLRHDVSSWPWPRLSSPSPSHFLNVPGDGGGSSGGDYSLSAFCCVS